MPRLTVYQQGLWERYQRAIEEEADAREQAEIWKSNAYQAARDRQMYKTALERENLSVEKLEAAAAKEGADTADEVNTEANGNGHVPGEINKTHAIIETFQKFGEAGLGPTEAWNFTVQIYPDAGINRGYVNTVIGKLKDRGLVDKDKAGKYVLTAAGRKFAVATANSGLLFENHSEREE
jgi:hypothetical protein